MAQASRDQNNVPTLLGVSSVDGVTPTLAAVDPTTHRVLVDLPSGTGTVTSVSVTTANGVSGSVATATTTPAITLTLGAITPSSVNSVVLSGSATPTLAVTGTSSISGSNTGDNATNSNYTTLANTIATANSWTATQTFKQIIDSNNAITASGNAATVPITYRLNTVTNNSAATLTITMTTTSAVDGQLSMVRILDASGVAQTITWVNTENSSVTAPTTSNGSQTLPLTVGFQFNGATSNWRTIAVI